MCFSLGWLAQIAVWIVVAVATYIILIQILLPYLLKKLAPSGQASEGLGVFLAVLKVFLWAVIIIIVIYVVFALLACLWSMAGGFPSILPHHG
jgi:hypothetical protein